MVFNDRKFLLCDVKITHDWTWDKIQVHCSISWFNSHGNPIHMDLSAGASLRRQGTRNLSAVNTPEEIFADLSTPRTKTGFDPKFPAQLCGSSSKLQCFCQLSL